MSTQHSAQSTEHRAPYMAWAKQRRPAAFDLAASNMLGCSIDDLEGAREALSLEGTNENGYPPLLQAIAAHYGVAPSRVMTGNGCSGANLLVMGATVSPGDDVLVERPYYDPFAGTARFVGAHVRYFDRRFEDGYQLDLDALRRAMTPRTRLVVLTNPHNPGAVLLDDAAIIAAAAIAAEGGATLLVDEAYLDIANIMSGGKRHTPAASLASNAVSTSSLTKSHGLNALRCGWAIAPEALVENLRRTRDVVDGIGPVPIERLAVLAFRQMDKLTERARGIAARNLGIFQGWIGGMPGLQMPAPARATIVFPRVAGVEDTRRFTEDLQRDHDVAVVPGHFFGEPRNIRISLAGRPDVLKEGLSRLSSFMSR